MLSTAGTVQAQFCTGGLAQDCRDRFRESYSSDREFDREWSNCLFSPCGDTATSCRCSIVVLTSDTGTIKCIGGSVLCSDFTEEAACKQNRCNWEGVPTPTAFPSPSPTVAPTTTCQRPFDILDHGIPGLLTSNTIADLNGDGMMDTIGLTYGRLVWYKQKNDGSYEEHTIASDKNDVKAYIAADLNNDGFVDIVYVESDWGYKDSPAMFGTRGRSQSCTTRAMQSLTTRKFLALHQDLRKSFA